MLYKKYLFFRQILKQINLRRIGRHNHPIEEGHSHAKTKFWHFLHDLSHTNQHILVSRAAIEQIMVKNLEQMLDAMLKKAVNKHCGDEVAFSQIKLKNRNEFKRCNLQLTTESLVHAGGFAVQRAEP